MAKKNRDPETSPIESAPVAGAATIERTTETAAEQPQYGDDSARNDSKPAASQNALPANPPAATPSAIENAIHVMIEVPIARASANSRYASRKPRPLSFSHSRTLRDIADALIAQGEKRENGSPVQNSDDALAWMLERVNSARNSKH